MRSSDVVELDPTAVANTDHVVGAVGAGKATEPADPGIARDGSGSLPVPVSRRARPRLGTLVWDDMASLRRAFESPEGRAVAEDVAELAN